MKFTWHDSGVEPRSTANPYYPNGIDVDLTKGGGEACCNVALPYPARRIGRYLIECEACGLCAVVTTAGRSDDPRSVTVACLPSTKS